MVNRKWLNGKWLKDWALPLSMLTGASAYFLCRSLGLPEGVKGAAVESVGYVQPVLIFCMLTLTFCRIQFEDMRLRGWQGWLLAFQAGVAALLCLLHQTEGCWECCVGNATYGTRHYLNLVAEDPSMRVFLQSTMLCFLCPTATAAAVVTAKLGGNVGSLTAYTMLINLTAAVLISAFVPLVNPAGELSFWLSFWLIIRRVFPLLIFPLFLALGIRRISPALLRRLTSIPDLPFYLWLVSLSLAIAVTTRILVHAEVTWQLCLLILTGSLAACIMQFAFGRLVGRRYGEGVTAGQACGQKNTVLAIWVGYTFLDPLTSVAGGFYTIWHNLFNAWQLYRRTRRRGQLDTATRTT